MTTLKHSAGTFGCINFDQCHSLSCNSESHDSPDKNLDVTWQSHDSHM